jgi:hypothetical protein
MHGTRSFRFSAAFAAVLLLAVPLAACGSNKSNSSSSSGDKSSPSASATPPTVDVTQLSWSVQDKPQDAGNLNTITTFNDQLILAGIDSATSGGAVWTSTDGKTWTRVKSDPSVFPPKEYPFSAAATDDMIVIVGTKDDGAGGSPVAWSSTDAKTWKRIELGLGPGATGILDSVSTGPKGFSAVLSQSQGTGLPSKNLLVTSSDGASWSVETNPIAAKDPGASINNVVQTDSGYVAVGSYTKPGAGSATDAAVWTSSDGKAWTRSTSKSLVTPRYESINDATEGGPGLIAVGTRDNGKAEQPTVWTSTDGTDWTDVSQGKEFTGQGGGGVNKVLATDTGIIAVGQAGKTGNKGVTAWLSSDGKTWTVQNVAPAPGDTIPSVTGVAASSGGAAILTRLQSFDASAGGFKTVGLGVYPGAPA